jgi:hypothetical protein
MTSPNSILASGFFFIASIGAVAATQEQIRLPAGSFKHLFVYREPDRFGGWPANNGVWVWGDEILVGFKQGWYQAHDRDHSIDRNKPNVFLLARSVNGGESWSVEHPDNFLDRELNPRPSPGIDFANPNLAIRVERTLYLVSYNRGKTWEGPYSFAGLHEDMTARTDYLLDGPREALFFLSAKRPEVKAGSFHDRSFCARTTDGGKTFQFLSWMTGTPLTTRSVMSSTVRVSKSELVAALRRRDDSDGRKNTWVDVYASTDNGMSWAFRSKVGNTGEADDPRNGNPPAMVRLRDGRIVVAYGNRFPPLGMRARISVDNGKTWGTEIVLRDDARTWDFGYPRMVVRLDGKIATIYYYTTKENPEQHIAATIWNPDVFKNK